MQKFVIAFAVLVVAASAERIPDTRHPIFQRESAKSSQLAPASSATINNNQLRDNGADNVFNRINDRLTALFALEEQQLKRLEALEYKFTKIEVTNQERTDNLRTEVRDLTRKLQNIDYLTTKFDGTLEALGNDVDAVREAVDSNTACRTSPAALTITPDLDTKLDALATLLANTRASVHRVERDLRQLASNVTILQSSSKDILQLQRNIPTKQFLNNALFSQKSQPIYAVVQGGAGGQRTGLSDTDGDLPSSCSQVSSAISGVYRVHNGKEPYFVNCDLETSVDKWTVVLNRFDGLTNFYRNWVEYKNGFGNVYGEFWMGLERLHEITSSKLHELYIVLEDFEGVVKTARYSLFAVGSEREDYAMNLLGAYSGDAGDSLSYHAGQKFSTFDADNDVWVEGNCAQSHTGGWWYQSCDKSNLNGKYLRGEVSDQNNYQGVYWNEFNGPKYSLKKVKMMIRPVD